MNYKIKRFLLGASTLLVAGVAYAKENTIPWPSPNVPSNSVQSSNAVLKADVAAVDQQVQELQKQVQLETLQSQNQASYLKTLQAQEEQMKAQALATARAQAAALASQSINPPSVQSTTKASGGGHDDKEDHGGDESNGDD